MLRDEHVVISEVITGIRVGLRRLKKESYIYKSARFTDPLIEREDFYMKKLRIEVENGFRGRD